jgi:peptidoglycan hydrolase CwlO-like protein
MGLKGFLVKAGVVTDDSPKQAELPATKQTPPPMPAIQPALGAVAVQAPVQVESAIDTAVVEKQINDMIAAQPDFAQFATFQKAVESLNGVIPDEGTKFQAAAKMQSLTQAALVASVSSFKAVLDSAQADFDTNFVGQAEANIQGLNDQSASIVNQIAELTKQLGELSDKKSELTKQVTAATATLAKAKIDFASVSQTITGRYSEYALKLQQYVSA